MNKTGDPSPIDIQEIFFRDVSNIPIISGKKEYILLLRRIQRKTYYKEVFNESMNISGEQLWGTSKKYFVSLNTLLTEGSLPQLDLDILSREIDPFFDNPSISAPPCMQYVLQNTAYPVAQRIAVIELAWSCFYLLSLFPPEERQFSNPPKDYSKIEDHLQQKLVEAENARSRLLEGVIRYVSRVALTHLGNGIPYLDLLQEGMIGLYKATLGYKEFEGSNFQQYSSYGIRQRIDRFISEHRFLIRIPVHKLESLKPYSKNLQAYMDQYGEIPDDQSISSFLKTVNVEEDYDIDNNDEKAEDVEDYENTYHKSFVELFKLIFFPMISLDENYRWTNSIKSTNQIEEFLVYEPNFENDFAYNQLKNDLVGFLKSQLDERLCRVLTLRYGLEDGEPRTLEEVSKFLNVTRERVRQIEQKALRKLQNIKHKPIIHDCFANHSGFPKPRKRMTSRIQNDLETHRLNRAQFGFDTYACNEKKRLVRLQNRYIQTFRERNTQGLDSSFRRKILSLALDSIGHPEKTREIYARAKIIHGSQLPFSELSAYALMFNSPHFRALGNGFFTLAQNHDLELGFLDENGVRVFPECPDPLLPINHHPKAFLESILLVKDAVGSRPQIKAEQLYREMQTWAGVANNHAQQAFNAWYAAGVLEWLDYHCDKDKPVHLSLSPDSCLSEIRFHSLINLSQRIIKMTELLTSINHLMLPSTKRLHQVLFGDEGESYRVKARLDLLQGLEAVQMLDSGWRLTDLGRLVLQFHPEPDLPEFLEISTEDLEDPQQELELDFDLFELENE
jgi:RNA polymerase sigma factor (sigma-70 family)